MSLIVTDKPFPPSLSLSNERREEIAKKREKTNEARAIATKFVEKLPDKQMWDSIKARNVPPEITNSVMEDLDSGLDAGYVRRKLGIKTSTDPRWKKILASVRQGTRIDSIGMFRRILTRNEIIASKIFENLVGKDGEGKIILSKESAMNIDAFNRLQASSVKIGKDLGVYADPNEARGGGGVTINVITHVPMPSEKEIEAHQKQTIVLEKKKDGKAEKP